MDWTTLTLIVSVIILGVQFLWKRGTKGFDIFEKQGIPYLKPLPFVGTNLPLFRLKVSVQEFLINTHKKFPDARIIGLFDRTSPLYMIQDAELIKQIGIKDFEHFISE